MKKSILSASIAAMIGGLGLVGGVNAAVLNSGATGADTLAVDSTGVGHILLVPYFTTQGTNATLLNVVNTDATNGKLVKVRFRGAANSDDLFDFQVLLSPSDVWTAKVSQNAAGYSQLETADKSCTIPLEVKSQINAFGTTRLKTSWTDDQKKAATREGYIEILTIADIPKFANDDQAKATANVLVSGVSTSPLYGTHKHSNGIATCDSAVLTSALGTDVDATNYTNAGGTAAQAAATAQGRGLAYPTGQLFANYTIIDTVKTATYSGTATAIRATKTGKNAAANLVFFPQSNDGYTGVNPVDQLTADPLLRTDSLRWNATNNTYDAAANAGSRLVAPAWSDFPDLSTPYVAAINAGVAVTQANALSSALAATSVANEYLTTTSIAATTDWVFSMPTRRYNAAVNYKFAGTTGDARVFTDFGLTVIAAGNTTVNDNANATAAAVSKQLNFFTSKNTSMSGDVMCVATNGMVQFDREETPKSTGFAISPGNPTTLSFCGETSVLAINNASTTTSGSLSSTSAIQSLTLSASEGWLTINTLGLKKYDTAAAQVYPGANATTTAVAADAGGANGLPVLGAAYAKSSAFGAAWNHRYTR